MTWTEKRQHVLFSVVVALLDEYVQSASGSAGDSFAQALAMGKAAVAMVQHRASMQGHDVAATSTDLAKNFLDKLDPDNLADIAVHRLSDVSNVKIN